MRKVAHQLIAPLERMLLSRITGHPAQGCMTLGNANLIHILQGSILQSSRPNIYISGPSIVAIVGDNIRVAVSRIIVLLSDAGSHASRRSGPAG